MRKLKANEKIIKEYDRYILIEVACPKGNSYRTTIDKFESKDEAIVDKHENKSKYECLGFNWRKVYER